MKYSNLILLTMLISCFATPNALAKEAPIPKARPIFYAVAGDEGEPLSPESFWDASALNLEDQLFNENFNSDLFNAFAEGGVVNNGGNEEAFSFYQCAHTSLQKMLGDRKFNSVPSKDLLQILKSAKIYVTKKTLTVGHGASAQEVSAVNKPSTKEIWVNEKRWLAITSLVKCESLALHEVLDLAGLESSGNYRISQVYFSYFTNPPPKNQRATATPRDLLPVARNADGTVRIFLNGMEAIKYCHSQGNHLPTARELAEFAMKYGAPGTSRDWGGIRFSLQDMDGRLDQFEYLERDWRWFKTPPEDESMLVRFSGDFAYLSSSKALELVYTTEVPYDRYLSNLERNYREANRPKVEAGEFFALQGKLGNFIGASQNVNVVRCAAGPL